MSRPPRITAEQVQAIRAAVRAGHKLYVVARHHRCSIATVSKIARGERRQGPPPLGPRDTPPRLPRGPYAGPPGVCYVPFRLPVPEGHR